MKTFGLSTKTKKEIRYFSSLLLMLLASMGLLAMLTSCKKETRSVKRGTYANVQKLRLLNIAESGLNSGERV